MTLGGWRVTGQVNFNSHTDTVVGMAVALVNLLTPGEDRSRAYAPPTGAERAEALNALFKSADSRSQVTPAEAEAFVRVAADLRPVFTSVAGGDIDSAAHRVNDLLAATGAHPALDSTFVIIQFEEAMVNDVVYVEGAVGNIYMESPADLQRYKQMFSRLRSIALSPDDSIALVNRTLETYKA